MAEELAKQSLLDHFVELKKRVGITLLGFIIASAACYGFAEHIYNFLVEPLASAFEAGESRRLIYTGLTEAFVTYLRLAVFGGFILSFPVLATQLYLFLAPGLYKSEKRTLIPYLIAAPIMFIAGAAFVYYLIFPMAWQFFLGFESAGSAGHLPIQLEARVSEYLGLVTQLIIAFGLAFQLPVVLVLLVRSGLMKLATLKRGRRYAVVIIVTLSAIVTPPDVFSQIALSLPLYLLYEVAILLCKDKKT